MKIALFFCGLFLCVLSYGQQNYLPGYLIDLQGDTQNGYIDYREWERNPDKIFFKATLDQAATVHTPTSIAGFGVADEIYVSGIVELETSTLQTSKLGSNPALQLQTDTTFLQTLYAGVKSLYYYKNERGRENFYIRSGGDYELLIYKKYEERIDGQNQIVENDQYKRQLSDYLTDCPAIFSVLREADYTSGSMQDLFAQYYTCIPDEPVFQRQRERVTVEFGLVAGLSSTSLSFSSDAFTSLVATDYPTSTNPAVGLSLNIVLPRNQGKWSIYNELLYTSYNVAGTFEDYESDDKYTIIDTELGYNYVKLNNFLRLKYPVGEADLFFQAGISNGYAISETNRKREEMKLFTTERVTEEEAIAESRQLEQGYLFGLGLQYNRLSLQARYERGNGMSKFPALKSTTRRYFLLLGYRF